MNGLELYSLLGHVRPMKKPRLAVGPGRAEMGGLLNQARNHQPRALALATTLSTVKPNFSISNGPGAEAP